MPNATLTPSSDISVGSWVSTPLFSKINDDIDAPDAIEISNTARKDKCKLGMGDSQSDLDNVSPGIFPAPVSPAPVEQPQLQVRVPGSVADPTAEVAGAAGHAPAGSIGEARLLQSHEFFP